MPRLPALLAPLALLLLPACAQIDSGLHSYNRGVLSLEHAQSPELADDAADQVDGTYKGLTHLVVNGSEFCPQPTEGTVEIGDHQMVFAYNPATTFVAHIARNGNVIGFANGIKLEGRVAEGKASFTVTSPKCTTHYSFRYVI